LFARVDPAVVAEIAPELQHLRLDAGATMIREAEAGDSLYLVVRGQLRVVAHAQDGAEIFLNDIEAGEGVGWDDATIIAKNHIAIGHRFDYTFRITALMAGAEMTSVVQEMFGDAQIEDMWLPCFCITTNLSRSTMLVHERGPAWKYTRATTSIPGLLPPVIDDGDMLVDGGLLNNLPTDMMRRHNDCGVVFAIDAAGALGSGTACNPAYETDISGWKVLWRRLNPFAAPLKVPTIGQIMVRVAIINDAQHMRTARGLADYYMRLDLGGYGMLEFGALDQIVDAGYQSAQASIASWQENEAFRALREA
jgi:lysophospholipid hydrolase